MRNNTGQKAKRLYVSGRREALPREFYTLLGRIESTGYPTGYPKPSHRKAGNWRFLASVVELDKIKGSVTRSK